jgi:hypothetical protein
VPSRRVLLATAVALAAAAPASAAQPYATASAGLRGAIRTALARQAPHTRLTNLDAGCTMPVLPAEQAGCDGGFALRTRAHGPRTFYFVTSRTHAVRISPASLHVSLVARPESPRLAARRGLPAQLTAERRQTGPVPPPQRTIHADVVIDHGGGYGHQRLSRDRWLAIDVPFVLTQAVAEGPVTLHGWVEHALWLPPGGRCELTLATAARLTATAPREEPAGRLATDPALDDDPDGRGRPVILARTTDPATGTITYTIAPAKGGPPSTVTVSAAPAGLGPPALRHLVVSGDVERDIERFGAPTADGYPLQDPLPSQIQACEAAATELATSTVPAVVAGARILPRAHPPRADPDDEGPIPVEPRGYGSPARP